MKLIKFFILSLTLIISKQFHAADRRINSRYLLDIGHCNSGPSIQFDFDNRKPIKVLDVKKITFGENSWNITLIWIFNEKLSKNLMEKWNKQKEDTLNFKLIELNSSSCTIYGFILNDNEEITQYLPGIFEVLKFENTRFIG